MNVENKVGETCCGGKCSGDKKCGCGHHKVVPTLIVLIGLNLLLGSINVYGANSAQITSIILAIALILIGGMKLMKGKCKCC